MFTLVNLFIMIENIKERIQKIIDIEDISSSKFAEKINVQRATISHVLNGRNMPSLDVVTKILLTFDTLNSDWLLFGKGAMYKKAKQVPATLFDDEATNLDTKDKTETSIELEKPEAPPEEQNEDTEKTELVEEDIKSEIKNIPNISSSENMPQPKPMVEAEKIILLNSDRTFTEYIKRQ